MMFRPDSQRLPILNLHLQVELKVKSKINDLSEFRFCKPTPSSVGDASNKVILIMEDRSFHPVHLHPELLKRRHALFAAPKVLSVVEGTGSAEGLRGPVKLDDRCSARSRLG